MDVFSVRFYFVEILIIIFDLKILILFSILNIDAYNISGMQWDTGELNELLIYLLICGLYQLKP